ncbi:MAG: SET domain-containing protein [Candidatus Portnoybacteria bacterium]|nr:SET domain-containing protein [Candidatus Portnoybacteria bacterium]
MHIKCYRSPKTQVKKSIVGGKGLFAKTNIKKGEVVFIKAGHIVNQKEARQYHKTVGDFEVQIYDNFFLTPKAKNEIKNLVIHFNHSCNPNAGPDGQITFVALRNIKTGEEITCDYATITASPYRLKCNCGTKYCRGIITGNDWKLKELQKRYKNNFSWFILKKIKRL